MRRPRPLLGSSSCGGRVDDGWRYQAVAEGYGVSVRTVAKWVQRFRQLGAAGLEDGSSRPQQTPHITPPVRVTFIRQLREQHGLPAWAIGRALRMPQSTVGAWLRRLGLSQRPIAPSVPIQRYEWPHPGDLLHVDIKPLGRFRRVGHRIHGNPRLASPGAGWEYVHVAVDDHTRLAYVEVLADQRGPTCAAFLERTVTWFGARHITSRRVMSDNGSGYVSRAFRAACAARTLRHLRTRPYTPRTNGKAERFIQTLLREWAYVQPYATSGQRRRALRRCCMKTLRGWGGVARPSRLHRSHTTGMKSKVHPTYKTKYRVANWPAYNQALVRRGDVTVWLSSEAIAAWTPRRSGRRGGQRRYSDLAIETALTLRLLYHLPPRQAEGFLHALFGMMRLDLSAPDYTTLSRRSQHLRRRLRPVPPGESIHLVLDSTGLSIVGAGEWATAKHGGRGRRGWRKLHLGVDQSGVIRVHTLTEATGDDATTALDLLTAVEGPLVRVTADAAYDTVAVYETARARGATVVIPPAKTATVSGHGPRSPARDRTIQLVKTLGRRQWKKASGYHRQGLVENVFFRYKSIIGDGLRARSPAGQGSEVVLGCEILNRMTALGRPVSYRIGR